ncbi:MAG: hypothetical protein Q8N05_01345 [Bacteroidota bacterium]|nr:hypothetical protein [Bacteroidota bacterium]
MYVVEEMPRVRSPTGFYALNIRQQQSNMHSNQKPFNPEGWNRIV